MEYCAPLGIPHSVFLGRVVGKNDPYWLESDQDKAIMWKIWSSETCPQCGTRNEGWVDEKGRYLEEPKYEVVTHKCFGCEEVKRMESAIPSDSKGVYVVARKRTPGSDFEVDQRELEKERRERNEALQGPAIPNNSYY